MRYCAFLRGVNVGGINIKMAELREVFTGLGFTGVKTVLASGNVVFDAAAPSKAAIERALHERFGYEAWIVLLGLEQVREIISAQPFQARDGWHQYVLLSSDAEVLSELHSAATGLDPELEQVELGDGVLYWEVERGFTVRSAFGKELSKRKYKATTTNRNLRTLMKIVA